MYESLLPQPKPRWKIFSRGVLITIIVAIVLAIGAYLFFLFWSEAPLAEIDLQVEKSDTIHTIASKLKDGGIIKHRAFFYFSYYVFGGQEDIEPAGYKLSSTMRTRDMIYTLEAKPMSKFVEIPAKASKDEIGAVLADALSWNALDRQFFSHTYAGMQWQHYQEHIEEVFQKKYGWDESKTHTFLTLSALYYDGSYDFLKNMYVPGKYEIPIGSSRAQVAGILIDRFVLDNKDDRVALERFIDQTSAGSVVKLIDEQMVLMPDIVAIPPQDLTLRKDGDQTYLLFTTSYWNKGRGPLELIADPKTKGKVGDYDRNVYQRIYKLDGDYTERLSGKFLWHSPHLHYHFQDFAVYTLEPVSIGNSTSQKVLASANRQSHKSTFCVRDSEPVDLAHPGADKSASYSICGKERQGISPGWADSYYYTYVDQKFNVTNLTSGEYKLQVSINPLNRFDEITKDNNVGEVLLDLDVENNKVKVISEKNYGL